MASDNPPNVLWICTDQQRFDTIAAHGFPHVRTPRLDAFAGEGVSFMRAYCQSPVCTPSRASFLTGRYPRTTRCRQNGQKIPDYERLLPRTFADRGYVCGLAGKLHLASCSDGRVEERIDDGYEEFSWSHHPQPDWPENAYTQWLAKQGVSWEELYAEPGTPYVKAGIPTEYHQTTWAAERTIDFLSRHRDRPWFFSFNCFDPHHPFDPPQEYLSQFDPEAMPLPKYRPGELTNKTEYQRKDSVWAHNEPGYFDVANMSDRDRREVTAAYAAMVALIDAQFGRILDALEATGQQDNTIVIFMSDHGEMLGDHGIYLKGPHFYEEAVRVPLIVRWPGRFSSGSQVSELVELLDLAPTLCDLAGIGSEPGYQGLSLRPLLEGAPLERPFRQDVFSEYYNAWTHKRSYGSMLRNEREKMVVYHGAGEGEFYDLERDPDEFENLWGVLEYRDRQLALMNRLFDRSVFSLDPLPIRLGPF